ncbi:MAG: hypothetical protein K2X27_11790 [Candidatus Obscuribacterales bacterium]|nr:hypothetical protein [Candidatus Obscuribacterales bacterium]
MTGVSALAAIPSGVALKDKFSAQEMQSIFCSLFLRRDILICKLPNQDRWRKWTGPLEDHQILGVIQDSGRGILRGCYWAEQTHHAVLDIDARSKYHNAQELAKLQEKLAAVGLTATPYRSSESGGWHLYIFFDDWAECSEVENTIKAWLKVHGYEIKSGTLEIFPSGNALRLPLQPGFAWLDQEGNLIRRREEITRDEALASFLYDLERNQRNWSEAQNRIESQLKAARAAAGGDALAHEERLNIDGLEKLFNGGKIQEIWEKGRKWWQEGLSARGERHDAVLAIGHYLWYGDEENEVDSLPGARHDAYRERLIEEWLMQKHNGYCRHIDQNKWEEIGAQIKRATAWRRDEKYKDRTPYPLTERLLKRLLAHYRKTGKVWTVTEYEQANIDRMADARERIKAAILEMEERRELLTISALAREAGASRNTVKRHRDLFACWSGEYNRGCRGGAVLSGGSCPSSEKKVLLLFDQVDSGDLDCVQESGSVELAPIVLTPPFLLPGNEPTSEPPSSISLRSLNGCLPSSAEPTPGPLHLPLSPVDDGTQVRRFSGRTADGAGGLEPSCTEQAEGSGIIMDRRGNGGVLMATSPANHLLIAHSVDNSPQVQPSGFFRYGAPDIDSACLRSQVCAFWLCRYEVPPVWECDRYVNIPQGYLLRVLVYSDVRGPPFVNGALLATFALVSIKYGAGG